MPTRPSNRRIWTTSNGTVCLRDEDYMGDEIVREFWVPSNGGYVRKIDDQHPGTLGQQVCERLASLGSTLHCSPDGLEAVIRREYRRMVDAAKREG